MVVQTQRERYYPVLYDRLIAFLCVGVNAQAMRIKFMLENQQKSDSFALSRLTQSLIKFVRNPTKLQPHNHKPLLALVFADGAGIANESRLCVS